MQLTRFHVYPAIFGKLYVDDDIGCILANTIGLNALQHLKSDTRISGGSNWEGLRMKDYGMLNACIVASYLLHEDIFSRIDQRVKIHIKSLYGMNEKVLFREIKVDNMLSHCTLRRIVERR